MRCYFVTGATGVVGSALVPALLEDAEVRVVLLIRAQNPAELQRRLDKLFEFWGPGLRRPEARLRVSAVAGDVTQLRLGLDSESYQRLARSCTHIVHSAGAVRMNLPIDEARRSSIGSAENIVALARECQTSGHLHKVEFVSTVGVSGRRPGLLEEVWVSQPRAFHNTYEQAKAEAECLIAACINSGLPATVHRPSMVIGDSQTGKIIHYQIFYHLAEFLSGRRTAGFLPDPGVTRLDVVPVDYVARAIVWSSANASMIGKILHLCSGPLGSLPLRPLGDRIRAVFAKDGYRLPRAKIVPPALFRAAIPVLSWFASEKDRRALATLPVFLDYLAEHQAFANDATVRLLREAGVLLPAMEDVVDLALNCYLEHRRSAARSPDGAQCD